MSGDDTSSLLDDMLDESAVHRAAEEVEEIEAREAAKKRRAAEAAMQTAKATRTAAQLASVEELTGLTEPDLRKVLAKAAPDHLLVLVAAGDDTLRRRILGNLSEESVVWIRQNLEHMGSVNDAERDDAHARVLKVANKLLVEGEIGVPEAESVGAAEAPKAPEKALREVLTDLVSIGHAGGLEALAELAKSAGEPLLKEGLARVAKGAKGDALRADLAGVKSELEKRYAARLSWMEEALVAIGEGESPEAFRARLFED